MRWAWMKEISCTCEEGPQSGRSPSMQEQLLQLDQGRLGRDFPFSERKHQQGECFTGQRMAPTLQFMGRNHCTTEGSDIGMDIHIAYVKNGTGTSEEIVRGLEQSCIG